MNTCWLILIATSTAVAQPEWEYGPWVYYSFQPMLTMETEKQPVRVLALFPMPQEDATQKSYGVFQNNPMADSWKWRELTDQKKINKLIGADLSVPADTVLDFTVTTFIARRSARLNTANTSESTDLTPRERKRLEEFLSLSASTGEEDKILTTVAKELIDADLHHLTQARRIYDRVIERLEYEQKLSFKGASRAWQEGIGECSDYAALFVSLCRLAGIPARSVAGFTMLKDRWEHHVWAEFYLAQIGWVPCDPSFGDNGPSAADFYFAGLDDRRVAVSRCFDLDFSPPAYLKATLLQEYLYAYEGNEQPELQWSVTGTRHGESLPADYRTAFGQRIVPQPTRRRQ